MKLFSKLSAAGMIDRQLEVAYLAVHCHIIIVDKLITRCATITAHHNPFLPEQNLSWLSESVCDKTVKYR